MSTDIKVVEGLESNLQLTQLSLNRSKLEKIDNYMHLTKLDILGYSGTPAAENKDDIQKMKKLVRKNRLEAEKNAKPLK